VLPNGAIPVEDLGSENTLRTLKLLSKNYPDRWPGPIVSGNLQTLQIMQKHE